MSILTRFQVFAFKLQGSEGEDAAPDPLVDAIAADAPVEIAPQPSVEESQEITGSLDVGEPDTGPIPMRITLPVALKGSGVADTPPESGRLLRACGWSETIQSATIPAAANSTATGGTATSFTIDTAAGGNEDWPTDDDALLGMPVTLSVNPVTPVTTIITGYSLNGDIATVEVADSFDPVLSATTEARVQLCVVYRPASTGIPAGTGYGWKGGKLWKLNDARGNFTLNLRNARKGRIDVTLSALFLSEGDEAVPAQVVDATSPPVWRDGAMTVDRLAVGVSTLTLSPNNTVTYPDNPNATEGLDAPQITGRNLQGSIDPIERLVATADVMADFRGGTPRLLFARAGAVAGNRWAVAVRRAKYRDKAPGDRGGIATVGLPFSALGADDGATIAFY